jgi:hypothetical protein
MNCHTFVAHRVLSCRLSHFTQLGTAEQRGNLFQS